MTHEQRTEAFYSHGAERFGMHHGGYLNFGLWEDGITDYVRAAEHLLERVASKIGLDADSVLLDVGCGMGVQDLFLLRRFGCRAIEAIDLTRKHIKLAQARNPFPNLHFRVGSACALPFDDDTFTQVSAIEGIVHFNPREGFFREAHRLLRSGGGLGASDFCLGREPRGAFDRLIVRLCRRAWHVPAANTETVRSYAAKLARAGFADIDVEVVSNKVIPGYLREQGRAEVRSELYRIRGAVVGRLSTIIDRFVQLMYERGLLAYVLVGARKV